MYAYEATLNVRLKAFYLRAVPVSRIRRIQRLPIARPYPDLFRNIKHTLHYYIIITKDGGFISIRVTNEIYNVSTSAVLGLS